MHAAIGFVKPRTFFQKVSLKSHLEVTDTLFKNMIFLISFVSILTYLSIDMFFNTLNPEVITISPTKLSIHSAIVVFSLFFIQGLVFSVVGKLFNVEERWSIVVACNFWATTYSFIAFILVLLIMAIIANYSGWMVNNIAVPSWGFIFTLKLMYTYLAIRVSMQTSRSESIFILLLGMILTLSIEWSLSEATEFIFTTHLGPS